MEHTINNSELTKEFGVFVGLYNKSNNTNYSVKYALANQYMVKTFFACREALTQCHTKAVTTHKISTNLSTKRESLYKLNIPEVDWTIYQYIKDNPGLSREDIAQHTEYKVSTVCGAINRLMIEDMVFVCGYKKDPHTGRRVQVLSLTGRFGE